MRALLRSVRDEPRPPGAPAPGVRDVVLVGLLVPTAVLEGLLRGPELPLPALHVLVVAGLAPLLLWRRTRPLLVLATVFAAFGVLGLLAGGGDGDGLYTAVYVLLLPYAVVRWGSGREAAAGLLVALAAGILPALTGSADVADTAGGFAILLAAAACGAAVRYRVRARTRELEQVTLLERERLARDLHDTVAHHVSAIAVRAQAGLATAATAPDAAADALRVIEAEASHTLAEMRGLVHVLRRDGAGNGAPALAPGHRIADLHDLAGHGGAGPDVDVRIVGDVADLPPPVAAAVYRLAQESVTNARRHARRATRIEVRVVADEGSVHLRVADDGEGGPARAGEPGFGLRGMAERVQLLGGTFDAGPGSDRGWTVTAVLPRRGPAA